MITLPWWLLAVLIVAIIYLTIWLTIGFCSWEERREAIEKAGEDPDEFFPRNWRLWLGPEVYYHWVIKRMEAETAKTKARTAELVALRDELERRSGG